jgi:thiol-disulfide isomerase/thioredoxin
MKQLKFLSIFILSLVFASFHSQNNSDTKPTSKPQSRIEVIDFYGTHRCVTCKAIEANAKYTVNAYFTDEQKKGLVVFKTINVDDVKNIMIVENFEAAGTALFLNVIKNGKETHIDLTSFAFMNGNDKETFSKELKAKIESELKKL